MHHSANVRLALTILAATLGSSLGACGSGEQAGRDAAPGGGGDSDLREVEGSSQEESSGTQAGPRETREGGVGAEVPLFLPSGEMPGPALHRLTQSELTHSLQDLLGEDVPIEELEPDVRVGGFSSIGASSVVVSPAGVGLHEQAVLSATGYVFADEARVRGLLPCVPESTADTECLGDIVTRFGRRAFRRPLADEEVQRFTGLATSIGNTAGANVLLGVRYALAAILQSPSFLYRVELGAPSAPDAGRMKYTGFEMASRLAAVLWDSVPDDALLDAAEAGSLATAEGVGEEAARLLADPRAERSMSVFADELFGLSHLEQAQKDVTLFPTWRESLKAAMREELRLRVVDMVFVRQGDFLSLYDDRTTFVNDDLADFYGLPTTGEPGFHPAEFPPESKRAGLLGAGAVLAGHALPQRNSPTARGKFVSEMLLCRTIPPPPNNVPPLPAMAGPDVTMRERLALHRQEPVCASCHSMMDPIGFGMEDFDSVGLHRTMEGQNPVDATGVLEGNGLDGSSFDGLAELGSALRRQPVLAPCLISNVFAEALGRRALRLDLPAIERLADDFAESDNQMLQLLVTLVTSGSFRFAEPQPEDQTP